MEEPYEYHAKTITALPAATTRQEYRMAAQSPSPLKNTTQASQEH